jgi:(heptosyl)LPS beta-1,4-glucosyltransferase
LATAKHLRIHANDGHALHRRSFDRHMCWDADMPRALVDRIWQEPHALLSDGTKLQVKPRCTVVRFEYGDETFVWKHHNWGSIRRTVQRSLSRSTARKTWADGVFLSDGGVPTPRPRAFVERRLGPFNRSSYVLTDYVPGTSLYRYMRFEKPSRAIVLNLAKQVAAIWQQLDELRVWHNDFKTENLLVDPHGKVWLIDLERTRRYSNVDNMRRRQMRDVSDLLHPRNWRSDPQAAEVFRQEILKTPAAIATLAGPHGKGHPLTRPTQASNRPSQLVTVFIPCRNAADTILPCIESVRDMADEILVADSGSTDDTVPIVRACGGCQIIEKTCEDGATFEAWAESHARHRWILRLLPDEQLNPDLGRQVQDLLATEPKTDGVLISSSVHVRGQRLRHSDVQHKPSIRLYRKAAARYENRQGRVEVSIPSEKVGKLRPRLVHELCPNTEQFLTELIRRAERAAGEAFAKGKRPKIRNVLWRAPWKFVKLYLWKGGWLDGWAGLHASYLSAHSAYLQEALLWSMWQPLEARNNAASEIRHELRVFNPALAIMPNAAEPIVPFDPAPDLTIAGNELDMRQTRTAA